MWENFELVLKMMYSYIQPSWEQAQIARLIKALDAKQKDTNSQIS
jgi:hypothetical protein